MRTFIKENWPPADGNVKSSQNQRTFILVATERGYMHRNIPKIYGGGEQHADIAKAAQRGQCSAGVPVATGGTVRGFLS